MAIGHSVRLLLTKVKVISLQVHAVPDVYILQPAQCRKPCPWPLNYGTSTQHQLHHVARAALTSKQHSYLSRFLPFSGGKLLRRLTNFQKTISCVRLSPLAGPDSAAAPRMLAGSLDGHVKIFELDDFKVTHASKYPAPVMSLGLSQDCSLLAVGMADGMLSVRKHAKPKVVQVGVVTSGSHQASLKDCQQSVPAPALQQ